MDINNIGNSYIGMQFRRSHGLDRRRVQATSNVSERQVSGRSLWNAVCARPTTAGARTKTNRSRRFSPPWVGIKLDEVGSSMAPAVAAIATAAALGYSIIGKI